MLKRQAVITTWHGHRISAGTDIDHSISREPDFANVGLLLVSPVFLASGYCYDVEMRRAMEGNNAGDCHVIPVILRHRDWHSAPFGTLLATPKDGKPTRSLADLDEAFLQVAQAIEAAVSAHAQRNSGLSLERGIGQTKRSIYDEFRIFCADRPYDRHWTFGIARGQCLHHGWQVHSRCKRQSDSSIWGVALVEEP